MDSKELVKNGKLKFTHALLPAQLKKYLSTATQSDLKLYEDAYKNWLDICKDRGLEPYTSETSALAIMYIDLLKDYISCMYLLNSEGAMITSHKHTPQGEIYEIKVENPLLGQKLEIVKGLSTLLSKLDALSKLKGGGSGGKGNQNARGKAGNPDNFMDICIKNDR